MEASGRGILPCPRGPERRFWGRGKRLAGVGGWLFGSWAESGWPGNPCTIRARPLGGELGRSSSQSCNLSPRARLGEERE